MLDDNRAKGNEYLQMVTVHEIRRRGSHVVGPLLGVCLLAYFSYHVVEGDRGLIAWARVSHEITSARVNRDLRVAEQRRLEYAWTNTVISSPSSVPIVGMGSNRVYFIGARNNEFTLEALDWDSGNSDFHYVIGGQRYNVMYSGTAIDEDERIHCGTPWGRVRLVPKTSAKTH